MLLVACAVIFELCLAVVLWRASSQRPSVATKVTSCFIGFAAACSFGLATQGFFLFAVDILQVAELPFTIFWLTAGLFGSAVVIALGPPPAVALAPFLLLALLSFSMSLVYRDAVTALVGF